MTSLHKLLAIVLIWLVLWGLGFFMLSLPMYGTPDWITFLLFSFLFAAAAFAAWAVARSRLESGK